VGTGIAVLCGARERGSGAIAASCVIGCIVRVAGREAGRRASKFNSSVGGMADGG
jgi:hypothetical protein